MPESFSPEQHERVLTRDEIIVQYRDHYETEDPLPVELAQPIRMMKPYFIQKMIAERIDEDRGLYNNGKPFPQAIERDASLRLGDAIEDSEKTKDKTGLKNEEYLKKKTEEIIGQELASEDRHTYDHIAMFSIDLNGLKALNDYFTRSAGDAYLQRIADWLKDSETLHRLAFEKGISITTARLGAGAADEFMILAHGTPTDAIDWETVWMQTSADLQMELSALHVQDIWPAAEIEKTIEKYHMREKIPNLPRDIHFRATAGFGRVTLERILNAGEEHDERNRITRNDQNQTMLQKLAGGMVDISLKYMKTEKNMTKANPFTTEESALSEIIRTTNR